MFEVVPFFTCCLALDMRTQKKFCYRQNQITLILPDYVQPIM